MRFQTQVLQYMAAVTAYAFTFAVESASTDSSDAFRQHDAHEHGHAVLNVVREGDELLIELISPAVNLVGFEHSPENEAQHEQVERALNLLADSSNVVSLPESAGCAPREQQVHTDIEPAAAEHGDNDHDEHSEEEIHSEFHARYVFHCDSVSTLDFADVTLFLHFPGTEEIEAIIVGPDGQTKVELTPADPRLSL